MDNISKMVQDKDIVVMEDW